nr:protein DA1-related 2-like isoform X1 [Ipomoea batatas]
MSSSTSLSQPCIYGHSVSPRTERKSRFMKWLSKLFKGSSSKGVASGQQPQFLGEENMVWRTPIRPMDERSRAKEREELERAIARSLAEGLKRPSGYRWRADNDDDVTRSLRGNGLNSSTFPSYPPQYAPRDYSTRGYRKLALATIWDAWELSSIQNAFVVMRVVTLSQNMRNNAPVLVFIIHVGISQIPANGSGLIEYRCHPFWSQKYCPSHEHDNTARCCSCERLESWDARYVSLGDGRSLCLECMESAIMDTGDCQPLYHSIRDFYEGMNMRIDQQVPMLLVERQALNEAIEGEKHGFHHMPETRGLCLSEEQTVSSIQRRPRMGGRGFVGMRTQPQRLPRRCEVTAILVLYGLPRLLTGAILAHELMHAWLRLKGYRNLNPQVEEGICQVLSHMWLESEKGGRSASENKLGEFFKHQILNDASPAYGEGFRAAHVAVNKTTSSFVCVSIVVCNVNGSALAGNRPRLLRRQRFPANNLVNIQQDCLKRLFHVQGF